MAEHRVLRTLVNPIMTEAIGYGAAAHWRTCANALATMNKCVFGQSDYYDLMRLSMNTRHAFHPLDRLCRTLRPRISHTSHVADMDGHGRCVRMHVPQLAGVRVSD